MIQVNQRSVDFCCFQIKNMKFITLYVFTLVEKNERYFMIFLNIIFPKRSTPKISQGSYVDWFQYNNTVTSNIVGGYIYISENDISCAEQMWD